MKLKCPECKEEFEQTHGNQRFCCKTCSVRFNTKRISKEDKYVTRFIRRLINKQLLFYIKNELGCSICGNMDIHHSALDFHHVNNNKFKDIAILVNGGDTYKLLDEISKCVIMCSNCHRVVHFEGIWDTCIW